ncbi:ribbon-helix-helix domain-containing protein [Alphaproteobacteria bacterium LSUCC0684]
MIKRSLSIKGHRTSISLEEPFWQVLAGIARREGLSLSALVARIDLERTAALARGANMGGLSSEIRIYVLKDVLSRIDRRTGSKSC